MFYLLCYIVKHLSSLQDFIKHKHFFLPTCSSYGANCITQSSHQSPPFPSPQGEDRWGRIRFSLLHNQFPLQGAEGATTASPTSPSPYYTQYYFSHHSIHTHSYLKMQQVSSPLQLLVLPDLYQQITQANFLPP